MNIPDTPTLTPTLTPINCFILLTPSNVLTPLSVLCYAMLCYAVCLSRASISCVCSSRFVSSVSLSYASVSCVRLVCAMLCYAVRLSRASVRLARLGSSCSSRSPLPPYPF